jgi:hypothetical protein
MHYSLFAPPPSRASHHQMGGLIYPSIVVPRFTSDEVPEKRPRRAYQTPWPPPHFPFRSLLPFRISQSRQLRQSRAGKNSLVWQKKTVRLAPLDERHFKPMRTLSVIQLLHWGMFQPRASAPPLRPLDRYREGSRTLLRSKGDTHWGPFSPAFPQTSLGWKMSLQTIRHKVRQSA